MSESDSGIRHKGPVPAPHPATPNRGGRQHSRMHRRTALAGVALVATGGCLDVTSLRGEDEEFHETGSMEVVVDGEAVDLTADRFQAEYAEEDPRFHFHEDDEEWHMERERVTFARAIDLLPRFAYDREGGAHAVTVDGERYDDADPLTEVAFRVDGEPVDPRTHEVRDGEHLVLEVTTDG